MNEKIEKWFNEIEVQDIDYEVSQIFRYDYAPHHRRSEALEVLQRMVVYQWLYGEYNAIDYTYTYDDEFVENEKKEEVLTYYSLPKGKEYICVNKIDRLGILQLEFTYKGADEDKISS